jgi:hypothetical protein
MAGNRTIVLKGHGHHDEGRCGTAISPGMAVEMAADGEFDPTVSAQAAALKGGLKVAKEDALQGKTIDDAYAVGDVLFYYEPEPGDVIHALVKAAANIAVGDKLVVEGGGSGLFVEAAGGALAANDHVKCKVLAP